MINGKGTTGIKRHRKGGTTPKSPAVRLRMKLDAEQKNQQKPYNPPMFDDVKKAFQSMRKGK